ncbi:hypothetical protein C0Q70_10075 [Pomacea canaliculata]|uniref:Uncharacterized protein n=1 Tax=Pomacea canaliculata TaxID=400727 RepID=A0A2T7PBK6_POMCA|nr:hypothetical protein C0Q70_10075 [Pomacea canaliculata]
MSLPTMVAMVGRMRAPHNTRVAEMGSDSGTVSAGTLDDLEYSVERVSCQTSPTKRTFGKQSCLKNKFKNFYEGGTTRLSRKIRWKCARALTFYYDQQQRRRRCGPPGDSLNSCLVFTSPLHSGGREKERRGWSGGKVRSA